MSNYPAPGSDPNRQNPFEPPRYDAPSEPAPLPEGTGEPRRVTFDEVFNGFWAVAVARGGQVLLSALPAVLIGLVYQGITAVIQGMREVPPPVFFGYVGLSIVMSIFGTWLTLGQIRYLATLARTGRADYELVFSGGPWLLRAIGMFICILFLTVLGGLACCIPGLIVTVLAWPASTVLTMEDRPVFDTLSRTRALTEPSLGPLTLVFISLILIGALIFVPLVLVARLLVGENLVQLAIAAPVNFATGFVLLMQTVCWCRTSGRPLFTDGGWTDDPNRQKSY